MSHTLSALDAVAELGLWACCIRDALLQHSASIQNKLPFNLDSYEDIKSCVELGEQDKGINCHYDSNYWSGAQML
jgi:hypothetical protein